MSNSKVVSSTRLAVHGDLAGGGIERHAVHLQARGGGGARLVAAQDGAHAGHQLARVEGLGQVIVGAQFQADDAVHVVGAGGQHEHRHVALLAQPAQDFEAVQPGQHDVQDYQVEAAVQGPVQAAAAFMHALHREAFALEELRQQGAEFGVVVD